MTVRDGPESALNLRAHNLMIFLEMAAGIDDRTWEHHRQAGDYSRWFREAIKNEELAREPAEIERDTAPRPERKPRPYRPGSFTTLHSARARSGLPAVVFGQEGPPFSARSPTVILTT